MRKYTVSYLFGDSTVPRTALVLIDGWDSDNTRATNWSHIPRIIAVRLTGNQRDEEKVEILSLDLLSMDD